MAPEKKYECQQYSRTQLVRAKLGDSVRNNCLAFQYHDVIEECLE